MKAKLGGIHTWYIMVEIDLDCLNDFLHETIDAIDDKKTSYFKYLNSKTKGMIEEEKIDFYDFYSDDYWKMNDIYPRYLRQSAFLMTCFIFESRLKKFCDFIKREVHAKLKPSDFKGGIIDKLKKYISDYLNLPFPNGPEWTNISNYIKIRNCLVHHASDIRNDNNKKQIETFIKKRNDIKIEKFVISLEQKFVYNVIKDIRTVCYYLSTDIGKQLNIL